VVLMTLGKLILTSIILRLRLRRRGKLLIYSASKGNVNYLFSNTFTNPHTALLVVLLRAVQ